jgi:hypothetical protein
LQDSVSDWFVGGLIVITSTSNDMYDAEERNITRLSQDGKTLTFSEPLQNQHAGITDVAPNGERFEFRAEVGFLSRNVVVQGAVNASSRDPESEHLGVNIFGGHIFVNPAMMSKGEAVARIEYVELRRVGQAFRLGRYPIHFHLIGDVTNQSYVRGNAIYRTNNRAVTSHGVRGLLIENNVAYRTLGHSFFVEDGIEERNRFIRNLAAVTRAATSLLNTDQVPASFWITNPNNDFIDNVAAGSDGQGFWFNPPPNPTGPSATWNVCPQLTPLGAFVRNTAHSNKIFGLWMWEKVIPQANTCWGGGYVNSSVLNFTAYANQIGIQLSDVGHIQVSLWIMSCVCWLLTLLDRSWDTRQLKTESLA